MIVFTRKWQVLSWWEVFSAKINPAWYPFQRSPCSDRKQNGTSLGFINTCQNKTLARCTFRVQFTLQMYFASRRKWEKRSMFLFKILMDCVFWKTWLQLKYPTRWEASIPHTPPPEFKGHPLLKKSISFFIQIKPPADQRRLGCEKEKNRQDLQYYTPYSEFCGVWYDQTYYYSCLYTLINALTNTL